MPLVNETVWFHHPSHTLILTDLYQWWVGDDLPWGPRLWASVTGVRRRLAVGRHVRLMIRDRVAAAASARRVLDWPIKRICVAHDAVIEDEAHAQLERAFQPLLR